MVQHSNWVFLPTVPLLLLACLLLRRHNLPRLDTDTTIIFGIILPLLLSLKRYTEKDLLKFAANVYGEDVDDWLERLGKQRGTTGDDERDSEEDD